MQFRFVLAHRSGIDDEHGVGTYTSSVSESSCLIGCRNPIQVADLEREKMSKRVLKCTVQFHRSNVSSHILYSCLMGGIRSRWTVHNCDLPSGDGRGVGRLAIDESILEVNDPWHELSAAVEPETILMPISYSTGPGTPVH